MQRTKEAAHRRVRSKRLLCAFLFADIRFEPERDETLCNAKHFLNIGETCRRVIVVVHQPVFVFAVCGDLIDDEPRFLKRSPTMFSFAAYFNCCLLQRAVQAEGLGLRLAHAIIGTTPFGC